MSRVGYMQFAPRFGEVEANLAKIMEALENVAADLLVLPELAFTGYAFADRAEARAYAQDPEESPIVATLAEACARRNLYLVTGFDELAGERVFNSALLIGPEGLVARYRKLHLFNREKDCFDPGDSALEVQEVKGLRLGMMICFDWIFPEVARKLALAGADLICHPANLVIPGKCNYSMVTRCVENRVFAITANRCGSERGVDFVGGSQIVAPDGTVIHRTPEQNEELLVCAIDPSQARDKRINSRNDLFADRRSDYI